MKETYVAYFFALYVTLLLVGANVIIVNTALPTIRCTDKPSGWSIKVICPAYGESTCKQGMCSSCEDCQLKFPGVTPVETHVTCINTKSAVYKQTSCAVRKCSYCLGCDLASMKYLPAVNGSTVAVCSNCGIDETIFWSYGSVYNGNLGKLCRIKLMCQPEVEDSATTGNVTTYRPVQSEPPVCRGGEEQVDTGRAISTGFQQKERTESQRMFAAKRRVRQSKNLDGLPVVASFSPLFGPQAGGTILTINGYNLSYVQSISIGGCRCILEPFSFTNNFQVKCKTSVCNTTGVNPLTLSTDTRFINSSGSFRFKSNPLVLNITRTDVIDVGGIMINFTGRNLGSSVAPRITVTAVCLKTNETTATFTGECRVCDDEMQMVCASPNVTEPDPQQTCQHMPAEKANYSNFDFVIGLIFDGYENYSSLPMIPQFAETGKLRVKSPPTLNKFSAKKVFDPRTDSMLLIIEGTQMNSGSQVGDYCITAGKVAPGECNCKIEALFLSRVNCRLPTTEPPADPSNTEKYYGYSALAVVVTIGNFQDVPGSVVYIPLLLIEVLVPVAFLLIVIVLAVALRAWRGQCKKVQSDAVLHIPVYEEPSSNAYHYVHENEGRLTQSPVVSHQVLPKLLCAELRSYAFPKESVKLEGLIGKGQFGNIFRAVVNGSTVVAAKVLKSGHSDAETVAKFLEEAVHMKDLNHPNVIDLYGVVLDSQESIVLIPLMEKGDLRSALRNQTFSLGDKVNFCLQIANGMAYLAGHKVIHRDLAARNCLLSDSYVVKIGDFGLAHELDAKDYYRRQDQKKPLPVKWMAPESLATGVFTSSSDVWSYGVVMWEIMAKGVQPYADVNNYDIRRYLKAGRRLECPPDAPDALFKIMDKCWHSSPSQRPTFVELLSLIDDFVGSGDPQELERHYTKDVVVNNYSYAACLRNNSEETPSYLVVIASP